MAPVGVVPQPSTSPRPPATPSSSPQLPPSEQVITVKDVPQFLEFLNTFQSTQSEPGKPQNTASVPEKNASPAGPRARASRLEFITVDERYIPQYIHTHMIKLTQLQLERKDKPVRNYRVLTSGRSRGTERVCRQNVDRRRTVGTLAKAPLCGICISNPMLLGTLTTQFSAEELGHDPKTLKDELNCISQRAYH